MNCTDIDTQIDDFVDDRLDAQQRADFQRHVDACAACAARLDEARSMLQALQQLPLVEPSADFEHRVFARLRQQHRAHMPNRFVAGFATAMAASLAIWFASTVYLPDDPVGSQQAPISIAVNQAQTVRLMFEAQADIQQVSLSIGLPDNIELSGYPGRKQLSWQTSLKKGQNILALPIMAVDQGQGELVAQLNYGDKTKTFRVVLKTADDGAMHYQLQDISSA